MTINLKRTFIAVKVNPDHNFIRDFLNIRQKLDQEKISWVKTENLHITLRFLGDTAASDIDKIKEILDQVTNNTMSFQLNIRGAGIFPTQNNPRVLWLGLDNIDPLSEIKNKIDNELKLFSLKPDKNKFNPHLTLGRIKIISEKGKSILTNIISNYTNHVFQKLEIHELIFYESTPGRDGPSYKAISINKLML